MKPAIVITGTGSAIPEVIVPNRDFMDRAFLDEEGNPFPHPNEIII
ncbi:MAG TPA: 3-oxoacyl-ACP synthase, partial [Cryomorphaceae bacterium]|nr:3-oxoacyl-ACP synthase [Cryomorphaceae bacterium]